MRKGHGGEWCSCVAITDSRDSGLLLKEGWRDEAARERETTGQTIFSSPLERSLYILIKPSALTGV